MNAFCTIFRAWPVSPGLGAELGRKMTDNGRNFKYHFYKCCSPLKRPPPCEGHPHMSPTVHVCSNGANRRVSATHDQCAAPKFARLSRAYIRKHKSQFVVSVLGRFPAKLGPKTPLDGPGSKKGVENNRNHPRRPIITPFRDHFLFDHQNSNIKSSFTSYPV